MSEEIRLYSDLEIYGSAIFSQHLSEFPPNPKVGTILVKDRCLFAYIKIGDLETWWPFANATNSYVHVQALDFKTWVVNHNLGTSNVWFQAKDRSGNILVVGRKDLSENQFQLNFTTPTTGTCVVVAPESIRVPQVTASSLNVAGGVVEVDNTGIRVNGNYVLTTAVITSEIDVYVTAERNRAQQVENLISQSITEEVNNLTRLQASFSQEISRLLTLEEQRAKNVETTLNLSLTQEINRAQQAETDLSQTLTQEINRAQQAETSLSQRVDNLLSNIDPIALDSITEVIAFFQSEKGQMLQGLAIDFSTMERRLRRAIYYHP